MTEADWFTWDDPSALLRADLRLDPHRFRHLAVAWGGRIRHLFDDHHRVWFEAFERWVGGAGRRVREVCRPPAWNPLDFPSPPQFWARECAETLWRDDPARAAICAAAAAGCEVYDQGEREQIWSDFGREFRDLAGNPFRRAAFSTVWRTSAVLALANVAESDRAYDRLPILADALEEAGCDDPDILSHCRGDGPHFAGCWVVDLILGRK